MPNKQFKRGMLLHRDFAIGKLDTRAIDEAARTIELAFSSEIEAERWGYIEILDHSPGAVRMATITNGAPLLVDHDRSNHIGTIESARIDTDRKGRAIVRYGSVGKAADEFQLAVEGIRLKASVGYRIHDWQETSEKDGPTVIRITDWEPEEISIVALPLDDSVGIGRSASQNLPLEIEQMPDEIKQTEKADKTEKRAAALDVPAPVPAPAPVDVSGQVREAVNAESTRTRGILEVADLYPANPDVQRFARSAVRENMPLSEFQLKIHDLTKPAAERAETHVPDDAPVTELGMSKREVEKFSLFRAVRAIAAAKEGGPSFRTAAPFEYECSTAIEDALDVESRGFFVPYDVQRSGLWVRPETMARRNAQMYGARAAPLDVTENIHLVATDHVAGGFIHALRAQSVLFGLGAQQLTGLVGDVDIPKTVTPASFTWLAEDGSSADSDVVTGVVALSPKTISGSVPITRRLRKQSSPDVEMMIREDLTRGAGLAVDLGGLAGTGASNQPTGIFSTGSVGTSTIASAAAPTFVELVEFETDVAAANGLQGTLAYVTTAAIRGYCKTATKDAGSGQFLVQDGELNGYPVLVSTQLAANTIIFGNFEEVIIAMWGVLDIRIDTATEAAKDRVTLRAFQDIDIGIKHAGSFSVNA